MAETNFRGLPQDPSKNLMVAGAWHLVLADINCAVCELFQPPCGIAEASPLYVALKLRVAPETKGLRYLR